MEAIFIYLDNLLDSQPQIREFGFQKLVEYGGEALPLLLGALMMRKYEKSTPAIMQIIEKIPPSPSINDIVPVLLRFLVDGNKPNYKLAYNFLLKMDENEIINNANEILTYNWSDDMWIQGVCSLLSNLNSNKLSPLVSPLINLLKIGTKKNCLDEHAIDVLAKIGSPKANEAVPLIGQMVLERDRPELRISAIEALGHFDLSVVKPIIPVLKECLSDEIEEIRIMAAKTLELLT